MQNPFRYARAQVPEDLASIVSIDHAAETDPATLGLNPRKVEAIWRAVERFYATGLQPAFTLELRHQGQIVLKRSIGCIRGNEPGDQGPLVPMTPDTPICLFSASKTITALLIHKLVDDGVLSLDERVSKFIPEFATHGKGRVTIRQLLAHRAGIPSIPLKNPNAEMLLDWDWLVQVLCNAAPTNRHFNRQAYHALTAGFIVGELVQRISGMALKDALREWLAAPLGCQHLTYGLAPELREAAPRNVLTGPKPFWPVNPIAKKVLGVGFDEAVEASNTDAFLSAIVPAGNMYATADDACRVFQMLLNGGELDGVRIFKPETVRAAAEPFGTRQLDASLIVPIRFSAGFMLGDDPVGLFGPRSASAFGHLGLLNVMAWADPSRDISVAMLNTGKSLAPASLRYTAAVLAAISKAFPQTA